MLILEVHVFCGNSAQQDLKNTATLYYLNIHAKEFLWRPLLQLVSRYRCMKLVLNQEFTDIRIWLLHRHDRNLTLAFKKVAEELSTINKPQTRY